MTLDQAPSSSASALAAAGLVHDLGNLIQIASSAIAIVSRTPDMPANHAGPMLRRASSCLDHAGAIVRNSIGLLRDSDGIAGSVDVAACLGHIADLMDGLGQPAIGVELAVEPGLPEVRCDPLALHSALLNLAFNARDAMMGCGLIAMSARSIADGAVATGVEIAIADDGIGMSSATIANAFDPCFTTKTDGLGGVGLPMVERFVVEAGGEIRIESAPGLGTTVFLRLPAAAPVITENEQ
jgi:signal transduction histidine kinase